MDDKNVSPVRVINWFVVVAVTAVVLLLCGGFSAVSYAFGRASAEPELLTETVTEFVEVTREVEVPMAIEVTVIATAEPEVEQIKEPAPVTAVPTNKPAHSEEAPIAEIEDVDMLVFNEVWDIIESDFDGELPAEEELLYSVIAGSLETLDDNYTRFTKPEIAELLRENMNGSVEGIGAFVRESEEGFIEVIRPISGQPAEAAGLLAGDFIIEVDGEDITDKSLDEVLLLVRGQRGTEVVLTIFRPKTAEELTVSIVRTRFEVPIIESKMVTEEIGYIHLSEFSGKAAEQTEEALTDLLAQGATSIILDLRDNPGGLLQQSVSVADLFLAKGVVLFQRNNQGITRTFTSESGDAGETFPLVVLVNPGSASASEIVAGAIRDNGRGMLIGETTFGKGSVQSLHELSDGSELRVTIARWYTPNNISISKEGIRPEIEVPSPDSFTLGGEGDTQLERAIEYLQIGQ
ncbi:MAG: carboxyl-terminal protease [Chloroflexi bacterium]|nr:MAG: carboxyl-terminal protease [Chloroflexota bacterium]